MSVEKVEATTPSGSAIGLDGMSILLEPVCTHELRWVVYERNALPRQGSYPLSNPHPADELVKAPPCGLLVPLLEYASLRGPLSFSIRHFPRVPVHRASHYHVRSFLKLLWLMFKILVSQAS